MAFDKPYDIDPSPTGDTVRESVVKNEGNIDDVYDNLNFLLDAVEITPLDGPAILAALLDVDGSGSLLDADLLDGRHGVDFAPADHSHDIATQHFPGFMAAQDKQKLDGVNPGAETNVQSDWNETSNSSDSFIRNKPNILRLVGLSEPGDTAVFSSSTEVGGKNPEEMKQLLDFYASTDFIETSAGVTDGGKPIVLDSNGLVHVSMIPAVPAQAIWGGITGTLSNQTDLQDELDLKLDLAGGTITGNLIIEGLSRVYGSFALEDYFSIHDYQDVTQGRSRMAFDKDKGLNVQLRNSFDVVDNTLNLSVNGYPVYHEGNPPPGGGTGDVDWGDIGGTLSNQADLQAALDGKSDGGHNHDGTYFRKDGFIDTSTGTGDGGKPIVLNASGQIDPSMLDVSTFYYVGPWDPSAGTEYPDTTGETYGAFWVAQWLQSDYTFTGGDLAGMTISNGDFMVWAANGWSIMAGEMNPMLYYKLDGSQPLTDPFQAGDNQLKAIADGTDAQDAVSKAQLDTKLNLSGGILTGPLEVAVSGKAIKLTNSEHGHIYGVDDAGGNGWYFGRPDTSNNVVLMNYHGDYMEWLAGGGVTINGYAVWNAENLDPTDFEANLGNPSSDGHILSSTAAGARSWIPAPTPGGDTDWGDIGGTLSNQTDLQGELDAKSNTGHTHTMSQITDLAFPVESVNGKTGALTLNASDVGALASNGKANDSDKLDGMNSSEFATSGHNHDGTYLPTGGKAADSELLDGRDSASFAPKAHVSADPPTGGADGDVWYQI